MNNELSLASKFARRELRGGLKGFRIFVACLALGVAAIAGVGSLSQSIEAGLQRDGKKLLGGDVALRLLHRPADEEHLQHFKSSATYSEVIEMRAMAKSSGSRTLVELKAVDDAYPLVGTMALKNGLNLRSALAQKAGVWGAVAESNLLVKLKLKLGDQVQIGESRFRLTGIVEKEPDRVANVLSFGPRLMIASQGLAATKLVQPGSQIRYRYRVSLKDDRSATNWIETLKEKFPKAGWRIRNTEQAAPGLQRFIDRMTLFLSFVGLTTLLVGGVGVSNAVASYLDSKVKIIATYKCLGAASSLVFRVYFIQIAALAGLGVLIGLIFGAILPTVAIIGLEGVLPVNPEAGLYPVPIITAAIFGILIALTFALWPLARAREIPAGNLFRDKVQPAHIRPQRKFLFAVILGGLALAALTIATANDHWFAIWFVLGTGLALVLLRGSASLMTRWARKVTGIRNTELRLALANLHRPGAVTSSIVLSLGLGLTVLIAIALIEGNLSRQVNERLPVMAPAFFFIDIQPDQTARFDRAVNSVPGSGDYKRVASLRGRIVKIAGVPVEKVDISPGVQWATRGDRALTYAASPAEGTEIVAGKWWPAEYSGPPVISLDANLARGFGVGLGDSLTLNILGREIEAKITSLRKIDWRSLRFDFAIIFAPGTLNNAPHSHIAALQAPKELEDKIEKTVSDRFNNISIIRVREALQAAATMLDGIGAAIRSTAAVTILGGSLVLAGAVAAGRRRRIYDAVVFKVLGATRRTILKAFLLEYGMLGIATSIIAALIGTLTAWGIVVFLMDMAWVFIPAAVWTTVSICLIVTMIIGFAGTWRALGQKAAPLLRNE
ncbi:MAG: FtsX-like permease family protein [Rhodospirillaceae bacterium]|jgi:putative ABC transport system permease protein|nr:FtsX-like permease family protein [Rhodospirillaceae bacterium]MBT4939165.1 FtsX-like permease family protein [Rhodospirillaceae bacterium]MBT5938819.1 FtsX-like permease family protein [Rhodospirillaceae bacterium]MBT7267585.1 FtsX-like permease family protein [Rhodospirillaceae bacterium]